MGMLIGAFILRAWIWFLTTGWPFGVGIMFAALLAGLGVPEQVSWGFGAIACAGGLWLRWKLRQGKGPGI